MREIKVSTITSAIKDLCINANYYLDQDIRDRLQEAQDKETFPIAKEMLTKIMINADIAKNEQMCFC